MNSIQKTENDEMIPLKFHLSQNYPNPFKEKTKIKYCVAYKTKILISVLNSEGKTIENLIDEEQEAGTYEIEFISGNLPEGIYICKIKANSFIETKKMILQK